ncbi:S8 family peptidase [Halopiger xanaduensis]|uniref:Peptidase S8 and S53 subtilisin kexin sedolisin n=1 Tax=Halopiger xanaduensis (strain DSM 18323 / JCM 14033 / SH-6) TaxID=797210 RepID=F8DEV3_HALXS|nr:S8 family serine peptidase [Halopiger xanaduensis]AEH39543.1 peptidase S8 and S53 subtilisin kexin sedolisin [Halopiger xanaduensis SH-6]
MYRRDLLRKSGATAVAITSPAFIGPLSGPIGSSETLTAFAAARNAGIKTYGDDNPSFLIPYEPAEDGEESQQRKSIREYVTSNDGRILRDLESVGMLAVSVPWDAVGRQSRFGLKYWSGGFDKLDYVEYADANAVLSRPETVNEFATSSEVSHDLNLRESASMAISGTSSPNLDGLAFDGDAPEATLTEARDLVRASDTFLSGIDTSGTIAESIDTGANDESVFEDSSGTLRFLDPSTGYAKDGDPTVGADGPSAVADGDGHGSWVTGCIAGSNGFGQSADILVAKSLGDGGSGEVKDIAAGIELAVAESADVVCLSLGSPQWSQSLADALEEAWNAGVFPVVAVGNDRYATTFVASPASDDNAFGVNATNVPESGDRDDAKIAYFGNVGPHPGNFDLSDGESRDATPKLAAPGMNVRVEPFGVKSGTSMAAPMVAGGALVLAAEGYDNEEIWDRLTACAYPIPNAGVTETEYGLLDVEAAVNGHEYEDSQEDVRNEAAIARDEFNRGYAEVRGRTLGGLFS